MTLAEVRDWVKTISTAEHFYIGKLDAKQDKSLGVYSRAALGQPPDIALGGLSCTKTAVKQVSLLLHWNQKPLPRRSLKRSRRRDPSRSARRRWHFCSCWCRSLWTWAPMITGSMSG